MFKLLKKSKKDSARLGLVKTKHGKFKTPIFMPDATRGFIKTANNKELEIVGVEAMVVNTYHLFIRPGIEIIKKVGGIHNFMSWQGPLISDSGGFQIFSLVHQNPKMGKITDTEVEFRSPLDGTKHKLTPQKSISVQFDLGVDMMVCLDDCPPHGIGKEKMKESVERTIRWARECKKEYLKQVKKRKIKKSEAPLLFAVIQGGMEMDLRKYCAEELIKIDFDGYGFGARPVDEKGNFLEKVLRETAEMIPEDKIRFALGIGSPEDIIRCASYGWDIFDCVIPTREGRHGRLFSANGKTKNEKFINISNFKFARDFSSINEKSALPELKKHSKAYLHHLFKMKESSGYRLASLNNLEYYNDLMEKLRAKI